MSVLKAFDADQVKPSHVSPLEDIEESKFKNELIVAYRRPGEFRPFSTWYNVTLGTNRVVGVWSHTILQELMRGDPSLEQDSLDGNTYKKFTAKLLRHVVICLREPTPLKDPKTGKPTPRCERRPGVYEVVEPGLREYLMSKVGQEGYERQKQRALAFYDSRSPDKAASVEPENGCNLVDAPVTSPSQLDTSTHDIVESLASVFLRTNTENGERWFDQFALECRAVLGKFQKVKPGRIGEALERRQEYSSNKQFRCLAGALLEAFDEICPEESRVKRDLVIHDIGECSRAVVKAGLSTLDELKSKLWKYGVDNKEALTEAQAVELLSYLRSLIPPQYAHTVQQDINRAIKPSPLDKRSAIEQGA